MSQRARDYNDSAAGARSNIDTQKDKLRLLIELMLMGIAGRFVLMELIVMS
jgi:hypothetical protein